MRILVQALALTLVYFAAPGCGSPGHLLPPERVETTEPTRGEEHLDDAELYLTQGLTDAALEAFTRALQENPRLIEAHLGRGDIFRERGQYRQAEDAYRQAVDINPQSFEAHYYLALVRQLQGHARDAVTIYLRALAIHPDDPAANRNLASAYLQIGRAREALPYAYRAVQLEPANQAAWSNLASAYARLGDHGQAVDAYRRASELGELEDPVLLGLADAHIRLGRYDLAMNVLGSITRENPGSATAHERLGYLHFKQREFDESLEHYRRAVELDDQDPAALNGVGVCLMTKWLEGGARDRSLRREAVDHWRQSLRIRPNQPYIIDLLARYSRHD